MEIQDYVLRVMTVASLAKQLGHDLEITVSTLATQISWEFYKNGYEHRKDPSVDAIVNHNWPDWEVEALQKLDEAVAMLNKHSAEIAKKFGIHEGKLHA